MAPPADRRRWFGRSRLVLNNGASAAQLTTTSPTLLYFLNVTMLLRSRFGVGALAAFLLGDEIHVATRRIGTDRGLSFTA